MKTTSIIVSNSEAIQWPKWTDTFDLATQESYVDLTARILCGLYDGTCEHCRCSDPGRSWYANSARYILPSVWPNGPLEMIGTFNQYAEQERMADKDKVRDPVSSAFSKLQEHAAFWTFVKAVIRERLDEARTSDPMPPIQGCPFCGFVGDEKSIYDVTYPCPRCGKGGPQIVEKKVGEYQIGDRVGNLIVNDIAPLTGMPGFKCAACGSGSVGAPAQEKTMNSEIVDPFGAKDTRGIISYAGDLDPTTSEPKSNTGVYVAVGLGVLLVGGLIGLEFYRASKGIRPVYVAPPMMPMYY